MLVITANIALENVKVDNIASECKEKNINHKHFFSARNARKLIQIKNTAMSNLPLKKVEMSEFVFFWY